MFLTAEKEDDIELTDLGYIQPARLPQKLHGNHNTLSNADQLTRHHLSRGHHSSQTGLVGPHSAEYYDTVSLRLSQFRRDGDAAVSDRLELPPTQHRSSNNGEQLLYLEHPEHVVARRNRQNKPAFQYHIKSDKSRFRPTTIPRWRDRTSHWQRQRPDTQC